MHNKPGDIIVDMTCIIEFPPSAFAADFVVIVVVDRSSGRERERERERERKGERERERKRKHVDSTSVARSS